MTRIQELGPSCTKSFKKSQIRCWFRGRIYDYIYVLVQNLKYQIAPAALWVVLLIAKQTDLGAFEDSEESSSDEREDTADQPDSSKDGDENKANDDSENEGTDEDQPSKKALIYARVSDHSQTEDEDEHEDEDTSEDSDSGDTYDEGSIEGQIEELKDICERENLELAHEPIIDKAQTGTDFDRDGIQKIFQFAQRDEVGYLLVEKIDRIGRNAPQTLYFIYVLQSKCEVRLITSSGERDITNVHGLMHTTLLSLMAEVQNDIRTSKAKKERVRDFVNKDKWKSYSPVVPFGYEEEDDGGWIVPDSEEADVVREIFETFNDPDCRTYADIDDQYGDVLEGHRVKTLLTNPVYVGRPQLPEEWVVDLPYDNVVEDPDLQLVGEETFEKTQDIIERKNRKHSTQDETKEVSDFIEEFGLFSVVLSSDPVKLLHDCGEPMVKDGQKRVDGEIKTHRYYCPECNEHRKWPQKHEHRRMKFLHLLLDGVDFLEALNEAFTSPFSKN